MELRYLAINDIGPFRGNHVFDFSGDEGKTGFVIFSKNGRGKTSLFNAMQWCLFGEVFERGSVRSGKWSEGRKRVVVGDFEKDKPMMNREAYEQDDIPEMSVLIIANDGGEDIQISRTAKSRVGSMPRYDEALTVQLQVTVGKNSGQQTRGQELIEELFPRELRRFFFIDGESLEEYVDLVKAGQVGGIKDDVEAVLRIPALTRGIGDLENIHDELWKEVERDTRSRSKKVKNANKVTLKKREIAEQINALREKERSYSKTKSKHDSLEEELRGSEEARDHIEMIKELRLRKDSLSSALERSAIAKKRAAANAWKVLMWKKAGSLYDNASKNMEVEMNRNYKISSSEAKLSALRVELSEWSGICNHCEQPVQDAEKHRKKIVSDITDIEAEISELKGGSSMSDHQLSTILGDLAKLNPPQGTKAIALEDNFTWSEDRATLENTIELLNKEEERGLDVSDSYDLSKHELLGSLRTTLRRMEPQMDEMRQKIKAEQLELSKLGGEEVGERDLTKENLKQTVGILLNVMKDTLTSYRNEARRKVENIASSSFVEVINAPEALTGIIIDENFNGSIKGSNGKAIAMPSSGQEMTMTLCIMDALRRASGVSAPIFFDTPGRSLDDDHKSAQLEYFWNLREHQFVIFPHTGEYKIDETIEEFGGLIGGAWELTWPADHKVCPECGDDSPLKEEGIMKCLNCGHCWDITVTQTTVNKLEV